MFYLISEKASDNLLKHSSSKIFAFKTRIRLKKKTKLWKWVLLHPHRYTNLKMTKILKQCPALEFVPQKKLAVLELWKSFILYCKYFGLLKFQTFKNFGQFFLNTFYSEIEIVRIICKNGKQLFLLPDCKHNSCSISFIISYPSLHWS